MKNLPEKILQHRRPGTELRRINGHYYLYAVSSRWNPQTKRTQKITGSILGKITTNGEFIPSKKRQPKLQQIAKNPLELSGKIAIKEFGLIHFFLTHLQSVIEPLQQYFPQHWIYIIAVAYCRLLRQAPINRMPLLLQHSFLSEIFPSVSFTEKNLSLALRDVGRDRQAAVDFMKWDIPDDEHILLDLTDIPSRSQNAAFAQPGFNRSGNYNGQINLLYIFGNQSLRPVFYRLIPGNIRELSALALTLKESQLANSILVMDKGFYSVKNYNELAQANFRFACPLKRNSSLIGKSYRQLLFDKTQAGFFQHMGRIIWFVQIESKSAPERTVFLYLDDELRIPEERDYLQRIEENPKEYTLDKFKQKRFNFGTLALLSYNLNKDAEQVYQIYKSRNQIEVMFDGFKNVLQADRPYMQNEETLQGWMFANHIALLAHHSIYRALLATKRIKKFSVSAITERLSLVRKVKINSQWVDSEVIEKSKSLFQELGFPVT